MAVDGDDLWRDIPQLRERLAYLHNEFAKTTGGIFVFHVPQILKPVFDDRLPPFDPETWAFLLRRLNQEVMRARSYDVKDLAKEHRRACSAALHAALNARSNPWLGHGVFRLKRHWLTLLGNRLATERNLVVGGLGALKTVASEDLNLSLGETANWTADTLFRVYCDTDLRTEWDYPGFGKRKRVEKRREPQKILTPEDLGEVVPRAI